jgi:hypothetical protein
MTQDKLTELLDREAIRDCLYRYCRGIDRADEASLRSAYWPDATDKHGSLSSGPAEGFIQAALKVLATGPRNVHVVSNVLIEFKSASEAVVESYFVALQRATGKDGNTNQVLLAGRYCDVFTKRGEEWRVADRLVVYDWMEEQEPAAGSETERFAARQPIGAMYPDDPIYALLGARK